jgi:hypothetical protein
LTVFELCLKCDEPAARTILLFLEFP